MKKRTKISIFGIALMIVSFFVYLSYEYIEYEKRFDNYYDFSKEKITQSINGDYKTFRIKRIGLEFETPNDWISTTENGLLTFRDKRIDVDFILNDFREWTQGCMIDVSLEKDTEADNFDYYFFKKELLRIGEETRCDYDYCSVEIINGKEFVKDIFEAKDDNLGITLQFVTFTYFNEEKREILRVSSYLSTRVPECQEHLDHFINSLKI